MTNHEARSISQELLQEYVIAIDDDQLEKWPGFFVKDCLYQVVARENLEQGLPLAIISCDGAGALADRIAAHRKANLFAPHAYRHLIGPVRLISMREDEIATRANYAVFRTSLDPIHYGVTELFSVGEYRDRIVNREGVARYKEKTVVVDTCKIQTLLVTPL